MGVCSRREADRLIEEGKVLVDGVPAVMGMKIEGTETVVCDGVTVSGRKKEKKAVDDTGLCGGYRRGCGRNTGVEYHPAG